MRCSRTRRRRGRGLRRPDAKYGETVGAVVVARSAVAEDALRAHCGERLAAFKVPVRVHVAGRDPEGPDRQGAAAPAGRAAVVKIAVLGAGAIGAYVGAALARGGRRRLADRARRSTGGAARARRHGDQPARRLPRAAAGDRRPAPRSARSTSSSSASRPTPTQPRAAARAAPARADGRRRGSERRAVVVLPPPRRALRRPAHRGRRPGRRDSAAIAPERAIGCVVYCSTELEEPGVVRHGEGTRFSLGEPDRSVSDRCLELSAALVAGGLKAPVEPDLRDEIWVKLLGNAVFNPLSVLTRATLGAMCRHPGTRALARSGMEECLAIANALGSLPRDRDRAPHRRRGARRRAPHLDAAGSGGGQAARARCAARRRRRTGRAHRNARADAAQPGGREHAAGRQLRLDVSDSSARRTGARRSPNPGHGARVRDRSRRSRLPRAS